MDSLRDLRIKVRRLRELLQRPDVPAALAVAGTLFEEKAKSFDAAEALVRQATVTFRKEAPEADAALAALGKIYDAARELVIAQVPGAADLGISSSHTTGTESIEAATQIADLLAQQTAAWAATARTDLSAAITAADKEVTERVRASAALQKAQNERALAAHACEQELLVARRIVRIVHGERSREYASLRDRRSTSEPTEPEGGAPPAAPVDGGAS